MKYQKAWIALPALNEFDYIHELIACLNRQTFRQFEFVVCVNQPDAWWEIPGKIDVCDNNVKTLEYLKSLNCDFKISVIDHATRGKGWEEGKSGVGWARKTVMDFIISKTSTDDIIISLDADTVFNENYFAEVIDQFNRNPDAVGMAVPYYHKLTDDVRANKAILRYEIYMRHYIINLFRIQNPYAFTALGSAMAVPVWAYKAIKGLTPKSSGEDFYFLQKLRKYGKLLLWNEEKVFPAARFSDRVFFGTGPAMIKGDAGDWSSYPIYEVALFDEVKKTTDSFSAIRKENMETPMTDFLLEQFNTDDLWNPLRKNFHTETQFIKACHEKVDGLRILQYLKQRQKEIGKSDDDGMKEFLFTFYPDFVVKSKIDFHNFTFQNAEISELDEIRNFLEQKENLYRKHSCQN